MIISVINHTNGKISDAELQVVIRAVNRQITEDFEPYWSLGATLRLEGRSEKAPSKLEMLDLRGDAILYLWDKTDGEGKVIDRFSVCDHSAASSEGYRVIWYHSTLKAGRDALVRGAQLDRWRRLATRLRVDQA